MVKYKQKCASYEDKGHSPQPFPNVNMFGALREECVILHHNGGEKVSRFAFPNLKRTIQAPKSIPT